MWISAKIKKKIHQIHCQAYSFFFLFPYLFSNNKTLYWQKWIFFNWCSGEPGHQLGWAGPEGGSCSRIILVPASVEISTSREPTLRSPPVVSQCWDLDQSRASVEISTSCVPELRSPPVASQHWDLHQSWASVEISTSLKPVLRSPLVTS